VFSVFGLKELLCCADCVLTGKYPKNPMMMFVSQRPNNPLFHEFSHVCLNDIGFQMRSDRLADFRNYFAGRFWRIKKTVNYEFAQKRMLAPIS
jgi:hypothetical protein